MAYKIKKQKINEILLPNGMKLWREKGKTFAGWKEQKNPFIEHKPTIKTANGTAYYVRTEVEGANGKWNDNYFIKDGYWVLHEGKYHHIYKTKENDI